MHCSEGGCANQVETHKWAKIRAQELGWYFMKDGKIFCPEHRPSWAPQLSS